MSRPTISIFRPAKDKDTGAAVVIAPGGGYNVLAWDHEGEEVATWLNGLGVTGIVLLTSSDDEASAKSAKLHEPPKAPKTTLRVLPYVGRESGGAAARFTF